MGSTAARCEIGLSSVKRYWPGIAPDWADNSADEDNGFQMAGFTITPPNEEKHIAVKVEQRHLGEAETQVNEPRADRLRVQHAEIVSTMVPEEGDRPADDNDEEETALELEERRARIREKRKPALMEQEDLLPLDDDGVFTRQEDLLPLEDDSATEDGSEYETDSEDEQANKAVTFVPKSQRGTIAERQQLQDEERLLEELARKRLDDRKAETKRIVVEVARREALNEPDDVSTNDESNEAEEYESWTRREIARIKRDREREKASNLIDEDQQGRPFPNEPLARPNKRRRFMQKYYHRGCFFAESPDDARQTTAVSDIFSRDFSAPTGEDKMDRTVLPKVMQVRNFGRRGRTKWTHLSNEDTTYTCSNMPTVFSLLACQCPV